MQIESFTSSFPIRILFISFSSLKGVGHTELDTTEVTADIHIYMHIYVYRYTNI